LWSIHLIENCTNMLLLYTILRTCWKTLVLQNWLLVLRGVHYVLFVLLIHCRISITAWTNTLCPALFKKVKKNENVYYDSYAINVIKKFCIVVHITNNILHKEAKYESSYNFHVLIQYRLLYHCTVTYWV